MPVRMTCSDSSATNRAAAPRLRSCAPSSFPEWSESVRLTGERETLGLYLTGHPIGRFESGLARTRLPPHRRSHQATVPSPVWRHRALGGGKPVTIAGLIGRGEKSGGPRIILTLDDRTGRIEVNLF